MQPSLLKIPYADNTRRTSRGQKGLPIWKKVNLGKTALASLRYNFGVTKMESQRHHNQKKKNKTLMSVKYLAICPAIRKSRCVSIITQMWAL
jgi:hypothetical protein